LPNATSCFPESISQYEKLARATQPRTGNNPEQFAETISKNGVSRQAKWIEIAEYLRRPEIDTMKTYIFQYITEFRAKT